MLYLLSVCFGLGYLVIIYIIKQPIGWAFDYIVVAQLPSCVWLFGTSWTAACQASLSFTISWNLPKFMSIALVMPSSPLILWCPLILMPSIFPASGTFPVSQLFTSDDQNIGVSASATVLPMSIQGWFPLRLTGLISLLSKGSDFDYTIMSKL